MIRLADLEEAIAECQGERNPDSKTCIKLAAFYILKDHLYPQEQGQEPVPDYSRGYSTEGRYESDTEFSRIAANADHSVLMGVIDELMSVLEATNPRLYRGVLNKLLDT